MTTPAKSPAEKLNRYLTTESLRLIDAIRASEDGELTWERLPITQHLYEKEVTTIIQSEYAETFKVAREAMGNAVTELNEALTPSNWLNLDRFEKSKVESLQKAVKQLRTAMELMPK